MAAPQLEVIISANIAALEKSLDTAEKAIENLNREAGDTDGLDKLNEAFDSLKGQGDAVKTELINTGKASKGLISNFKNSASSAGELVSAFNGLEGAAGEAATSISGVLTGFATGGLAGAAVAVLGTIISQWENIKVLTGDVAANIALLQQGQEAQQNVALAQLDFEKAKLATLEAQGAEYSELVKQQEAVRAATQDAGNAQNEISNSIAAQIKALKESGDDTKALEVALFKSGTQAAKLAADIANIDAAAAKLKETVTTTDFTPFLNNVERTIDPSGIVDTTNRDPLLIQAPVEIDPIPRELTGDEITEKLGLIELRDSIGELVGDTIGGTIGAIGETIGAALVSGANVIQALGGTLLQAFGQFLSQLGDRLIAYGLAAEAFEFLTKSLGTPAGIGAALGAIAAGIALKAAAGAFTSAAQGGFGGGGAGGGGGATGPVTNGGQISSGAFGGDQTVVFEIEGTKLVGVLERTIDRNRRLGSSNFF